MSSRSAFRTVSYFGVMHLNYGKVATLFEVQSGSTFVCAKNCTAWQGRKFCAALIGRRNFSVNRTDLSGEQVAAAEITWINVISAVGLVSRETDRY